MFIIVAAAGIGIKITVVTHNKKKKELKNIYKYNETIIIINITNVGGRKVV